MQKRNNLSLSKRGSVNAVTAVIFGFAALILLAVFLPTIIGLIGDLVSSLNLLEKSLLVLIPLFILLAIIGLTFKGGENENYYR